MSNIEIGYTPNYVDMVTSAIRDDLIQIKTYIQECWDGDLVNSLRFNWIGEDEQHYEKLLVEKINFLYKQTLQASKQIINTIVDLGEAWQKFQQNNSLTGETIEIGKYEFNRSLGLNEEVNPINFMSKDFSSTDARGLRSADSGQQIKTAIDNFVYNLKSKCIGLFNEVDPNKAFYGEQTRAIKQYIEAAGIALSELLTAIKEMYDAIDKLVTNNYFLQSSDIIQTMTSKADNSNEIIDSYVSKESRWS